MQSRRIEAECSLQLSPVVECDCAIADEPGKRRYTLFAKIVTNMPRRAVAKKLTILISNNAGSLLTLLKCMQAKRPRAADSGCP